MALWRSHTVIAHPALGGLGTNTWTYRDDGGLDENFEDMTGWIRTLYESLNSILAQGTLVTHDGQWVEINTDDPEIHTTDPWSVGITGASGVLPPSQCLVIGWKTSSPTRGGRGRTFLGPLKVDTLQDNGTPTEAARATVQAAADALIESSDSVDNGALGIFSEDPSGTPPAPVFRDLVGAAVANQFAVLRSRRD